MITFFIDNWQIIIGVIATPVAWIFGGKAKQKQDEKKGNIEIEVQEIDYAVKVRELYESLLTKRDSENQILINDKRELLIEFKKERDYFREQLDTMRKDLSTMQSQFNETNLAYVHEVQVSQNWEKLHRELTEKYNDLEKQANKKDAIIDALKKDHEKLRREFETYKKKQ